MLDDVDVMAGGAATPARLKKNPQEATAGVHDVAIPSPDFQCLLIARLVTRHRLRPPVAVVVAEALCGGVR